MVLLFIGISGPERSEQRVAMRLSQGGHDVPHDRLIARFPRILANLRCAIPVLSMVLVYDNDDLRSPYRIKARFVQGTSEWETKEPPGWWASVRP